MAKYSVTQAQFDILMKAAAALDEQGERSVNTGDICLYRGPNKTKCFVGHMISDENYNEDMELETARNVVLLFDNAVEGFGKKDSVEILVPLQKYHDRKTQWLTVRETNPNAMQDYVKKMVEVV